MRRISVGPYRRAGYMKRGRRISGTVVRRHKRPDKGALGKTTGAAAWSRKVKVPRLHKITGYRTSFPALRRQRALTHEVIQRGGGRKGTLSTFRTLSYLRNLNPSRKVDIIYKKDANWVGRRFKYKIK